MAHTAAAVTKETDAKRAGAALGEHIAREMGGVRPDAVIVFAAPSYDHGALLRALSSTCLPAHIIGCSSAGEFLGTQLVENGASALAISDPDMRFSAHVGVGMRDHRDRVATALFDSFEGMDAYDFRYRTALILVDALGGFTDDLIERLAVQTAGTYQFVGGGAGDNAQFKHTPVFCGTEVYDDAAVALEILSNKPFGIGVCHGWEPVTPAMRVTASEGLRLISLNAIPAADVFEEHARSLGTTLDRAAPISFFLHNILGVETPVGLQLRVPLGVDADGALVCAAEVPAGSLVRIMHSPDEGAATAAQTAAASALSQLGTSQPSAALMFDCVATRLRLGEAFGQELAALQQAVGSLTTVGCNSHGQIARAEGQFSGFHNCTAVVCAIPR